MCPQVPNDGPFEIALSSALAGDWRKAQRHCSQLLKTDPSNAHALHLMGSVFSCQGKLERARRYLEEALAREPHQSIWHRDLGIVFAASMNWPAAAQSLAQSLSLSPTDEHALGLYADALWQSKQFDAALAVYDRWRDTLPGSGEPCFGSARCLAEMNQLPEAAERARLGLAIEPNSVAGHETLADIYFRLQHYELELVHRQELVRLLPDDAARLGLCAAAHYRFGETDNAVSIFRTAIEKGMTPDIHSAFLAVLLHHAGSPPELVIAEHRLWGRRYGTQPSAGTCRANPPGVDRKLRIGYLSGEPANSPGFYFLTAFFRNHDRRRFSVTLYHADASPAECPEQFDLRQGELKDVSGWEAARIVEQIRRDRIDVLIDVSGHYGGGTLLVSAMRAAPIQVSLPNYPATTGVPNIDYILTDRWTCPDGQERQYTEQAYKLDLGYLVYDPPESAPRVSALPAGRNGAITFGVFQRPAKLNSGVWDAIAEILRKVLNSRVLIHCTSMDLGTGTSASQSRIIAEFESRGITSDRVSFQGWLPLNSHLALMSTVDIALDSFPYTGQTTTCECLWMGVPVVTLAGTTHVSRVSAGLLQRVGLESHIATNVKDYVEIAVGIAKDPSSLALLRRSLRRRVQLSTVVDGAGITKGVEDAYRSMWRRFVNQSKVPGRVPRASVSAVSKVTGK